MKIYYYNVERLKEQKIFEKNYNLMSQQRKDKIDRIVNEEKKRQSLGAGMLIRHICKTENITGEIVLDKHNKPMFENSSIHFNVSHSGNYVIAVVSAYEVGIDTEDLERKTGFSMKERRIVNTQFAPKEQDYIFDIGSEAGKFKRFLRVWTIKEAYVKMEGIGIIRPFYTFEVNFDEEPPKITDDPECVITEFDVGLSNHVAVCHHKLDAQYIITEIEEI